MQKSLTKNDINNILYIFCQTSVFLHDRPVDLIISKHLIGRDVKDQTQTSAVNQAILIRVRLTKKGIAKLIHELNADKVPRPDY